MKIKCNGQDILSNNFTDKDKKKLDSIQFCANNYKHPIRDGYKHLPAGGAKGQVVTHNGTKATWEYLTNMFIGLEEVVAYGVQFDITVADPHLTRIGNMSLHKSLPIQSQLKGCIAQGGKIIYWLNESDWRFRKDPIYVTGTISKSKTDFLLSLPEATNLKYINQWIRIGGATTAQILSIRDSNTYVIKPDIDPGDVPEGIGESIPIELGAILNGYDGTVRVYCPEFYIKSIVEGSICKVYISTFKIDNTYTRQPAVLIDAYRSTVLNTVPENMGYLSTLPVNSPISVVNTNEYCRGGENRSDYDQYLVSDPFKTDLGKPRTKLNRATMRTYSRNAGSEMLSYDQYKNIFYWLYVVEYANFNSQEDYNATLTDEGYHQGGMGIGITNVQYWVNYNVRNPLTPCGYGNALGNGTGLVPLTIPEFQYWDNVWKTQDAQTVQMPRWRGFDNPFGDIGTVLDGVIIDTDADNHPNNMNYVYTCQDASKYADTLNTSYVKVGEQIHKDGCIKSFDLGDAAHIIPHVIEGDVTQYTCNVNFAENPDDTLCKLIIGGTAETGYGSGLGRFESRASSYRIHSTEGYRTVSSFVSFPSDK